MADEELSDVLAAALADATDDTVIASDDKLQAVSHWIKKQVLLEDLKESLETQLKQCEKDLAEVAEQKLPEALMQAGVKKFETEDGLGVKTETVYYPAVNKPDLPKFFEWLAEKENDGIVNADVIIPFGKGAYKEAKELKERLVSLLDEFDIEVPEEPQVSGDIHWATFRAFAREQAEAGTKFPDIYSVYNITRAKITRPKKK